MARSVGEAISDGLTAGVNLALNINESRDRRARQQRADDIQAQSLADARSRQMRSDELNALTAQQGALANEVQAAESAGLQLPAERQAAIAAGTSAIKGKMNQIYAQMGGADLAAIDKRYAEALKGIKEGKIDPSSLPGAEFGALVSQATGHSPKAFMRDGDNLSPIEMAAQQVMQGLDSGDTDTVLKGLNVVLAPEVNRIKGKPSPHGGTIVGAEIAALYPDPSKKGGDDPHLIPMLKVYVQDPKSTGPRMENGATGYYMAPVTEGRDTGPNAKVKSISTSRGLEFIGNYLKLADQLNTPEGAAKMQEAYATPGATPDDWLLVKAQLGVKAPKKTTEAFTLKPGEVRIERDVGADGRPIAGTERRTEGNPKPTTSSAAKRGAMQQQIDAIDELVDNNVLTEEEGDARKKALVAKVTTGTKAQGLAAGGGKGGGKGTGTAPALSKEERADIKEESDALDKKERRIIELARLSEPKEPKPLGIGEMSNEAAVAAHAKRVAKYEADLAAHEKRLKADLEKIAKEQDELTERRQRRADVRNPGGSPKPAGGGTVLKFDKNGRPMGN